MHAATSTKAQEVYQALKKQGKEHLLLLDVKNNKILEKILLKDYAKSTEGELLKEAYTKGRILKPLRFEKQSFSFNEFINVCNFVYDWKVDGPMLLASFVFMVAAKFVQGLKLQNFLALNDVVVVNGS